MRSCRGKLTRQLACGGASDLGFRCCSPWRDFRGVDPAGDSVFERGRVVTVGEEPHEIEVRILRGAGGDVADLLRGDRQHLVDGRSDPSPAPRRVGRQRADGRELFLTDHEARREAEARLRDAEQRIAELEASRVR